MTLRLYNPRPQSDVITRLTLTPMAELGACAMAIGGGGVVGQVAYMAFNAVAMPVLAVGAGAVLFLGAMDKIHDVMCFRALNRGQVQIKTQRRPQIDP
jgi:hypothetical protein